MTEPKRPECKWCGQEIEEDENPREHRQYCKLLREFDVLMNKVEVISKALANMNDGRLWYASSRGTGFKYRVSANPKAELKQLLKMNPQLVNIKDYQPSIYKEAGRGLIDLALNGPREDFK